jgi:hypothetical protein
VNCDTFDIGSAVWTILGHFYDQQQSSDKISALATDVSAGSQWRPATTDVFELDRIEPSDWLSKPDCNDTSILFDCVDLTAS